MFTKIDFQNFRGFKHIEIDGFKRFNILVGKNNCGKSSILEGIFLLINPSNPNLPLIINYFRELQIAYDMFWKVFFNNLNHQSKITLTGFMNRPEETRILAIYPTSSNVTKSDMENEFLTKKSIKLGQSHSGLATKLIGLKYEFLLKKSQKKEFDKFEASVLDQKPGLQITTPKNYSENLQGIYNGPRNFFGDIWAMLDKVQINKRKENVVNILKNIEPSLSDLSLGSNGIIYCDIGLENMVPINVMGDGFCRFLSIVLAISDAKDGIVLIDELEDGLHYSSQKVVWEAIFTAAEEYNTQVFIATHSYECLAALGAVVEEKSFPKDEIRLFRIEKTDQIGKAIPYDYEDIKISLDKNWEVR